MFVILVMLIIYSLHCYIESFVNAKHIKPNQYYHHYMLRALCIELSKLMRKTTIINLGPRSV